MVWPHAVAPRDLVHRRPLDQRLRNDPGLDRVRRAPTPARAHDRMDAIENLS